jgi:hypothetical protein
MMKDAFLLKNERKILGVEMGLLCSQVFGFPCSRFYTGISEGTGRIIMAVRFRSRKVQLKIRCAVQDRWLRIPPQEQGIRFQAPKSTSAIYPENRNNNPADRNSPCFWVPGKHSMMAVTSSIGIRV